MKFIFTILLAIQLPIFLNAQCDQPTGLQASDLTSNSAQLSWTAGGTELYWGLEWGLDGFEIGAGTRIDSLEIEEYSLTGLEALTSYDYYVWAICDGDTSSLGALEFITLPSNNFTCDADTITLDGDSVLVDNTYAIPFGPQASCWGNHLAGDVWYLFELTEPSGIEIITSAVTSNDSHIALYEVSGCESDTPIYTELYCSEDISGADWMSYIITEELAAGTYYVHCGTWNNSWGKYSVWVNTVEPIVLPPNNECVGATISPVIVDGFSTNVSGNGTNATDENFMGAAHVWEAFSIDTCADVSIDFCSSNPIPDIIFSSLFDECPFENIFQSGELQSADCADGNQAMIYTNLPAGTYYYPVVAETSLGGFEEYTMNITATTCSTVPQPDTCTIWLGGPYGDFNSEFGGAPFPDTAGVCPIYTLDVISIWASESYEVFDFQEGIEYAVSVCEGEGAGSWPVEIAISDTLGNIIAWAESCLITFVAPYDGSLFIGFNEAGACGESSDNTQTDNGNISISCGGVVPGIKERIALNFEIYPNPSSGKLSIRNRSLSADYSIDIITSTGQVVWNKEMSILSDEILDVNLAGLPSGIYLVKMINKNDRSYAVKRLIIE